MLVTTHRKVKIIVLKKVIEYWNEDLDITFVANNYEDHCPIDVKKEAPTDVKEEAPLTIHVTSNGVVIKTKVLGGYRADYLH